MIDHLDRCVLLADRHHGLIEGVRSLLATVFETVVMVADVPSLLRGAERLRPALAIVDVSLGPGDSVTLARELRSRFPEIKLLFLTVHDEPTIAGSLMEAGVAGIVLKREISTHLLAAVDDVLSGRTYVSPGMGEHLSSGSTAHPIRPPDNPEFMGPSMKNGGPGMGDRNEA